MLKPGWEMSRTVAVGCRVSRILNMRHEADAWFILTLCQPMTLRLATDTVKLQTWRLETRANDQGTHWFISHLAKSVQPRIFIPRTKCSNFIFTQSPFNTIPTIIQLWHWHQLDVSRSKKIISYTLMITGNL